MLVAVYDADNLYQMLQCQYLIDDQLLPLESKADGGEEDVERTQKLT
jgi:hypothetical protein